MTGGMDDRLSLLTAIVFLFFFKKSSDTIGPGFGKMLCGLCIDRHKVLFADSVLTDTQFYSLK